MCAQEVCASCAKGKPLIARIPRVVQQLVDVQERVREELPGEDSELVRVGEVLERAKAELEALERRVLERLGLPEDYARTVRLRMDKELMSWKLWVPNLALLVGVYAGWIALFPESAQRLGVAQSLILLAALTVGISVPHEALHALGFWLVGRRQPGFKLEFGSFGLGFYAAGNCLLGRGPYLFVVLLPLVGITAISVGLWAFLPDLGPLWYLFIGVNLAGAVGDLWIAKLLLQASPKALCLDTSYEMAVFEPASEARRPRPTAATEAANAPGSGSPTR